MTAKRFRKRPVEIEAIQFTGDNWWLIEEWSEGQVITSPVLEPTPDNPTGAYIQIKTLEGVMTAGVGSWVIRGIKGEYYPCQDTVFRATYQEVRPTGPECVMCGYDPCGCDQQ